MSDMSGPGKQGIPAWQRTQLPASNPSADSEHSTQTKDNISQLEDQWPSTVKPTEETQESSASARNALLEQAHKFLQDKSVRNAPVEKKRAFLESKGLGKDEIEIALHPANTGSPDSKLAIPDSTPELRQQASLFASPNPADDDQPPPLPKRNIPPIITYPEFLMHANKPPPLITARRLLNTAYIATGTAALIYGASKYLITPIVENLTSARHDFAGHVNLHLKDLNSKLGEVVSVDPEQLLNAKQVASKPFKENDTASDAGTSDSDPTELFHRDYGTQTSQELATTTAAQSESSDGSSTSDCDTIEMQAKQLTRITSLFTDLNTDSSSEGQTAQEISTTIKVLSDYLHSMTYPPNMPFVPNVGTFGNEGEKTVEDEISKMKAEIRGVKGVLLSARHFPSGRRGMFPPAAA